MIRSRKIRFIEPLGRAGRPFNAWIRRWPLLGPITLASILHERGYDVAIFNENVSGSLLDSPEAYDDVCSADVVAISIMTPTAHRGYELADRIRRDAPHTTVTFGGVHATMLPQEALAHGQVVCCGEGENVIEDIASGAINSGVVRAAPLQDLDALPRLNYGLMRDFEQLVAERRRRELYELPVMTSRGCPYGCRYCSVTRMFGRKVRRQSVEKVYSDLCGYAGEGFRHFFFYDDNLTVNRAWARELLERLSPLQIRFNAQVRTDFHWTDRARTRTDQALLRAMRRAGADVLYVGYETVDDSTAQAWGKGYGGRNSLRHRLLEDTAVLHDSGFWIHGMFILGPQHTRRTADQIVDFARRGRLESMQISLLTPFPGTPLFDEMRPHLIFTDFPSDWDYYDGTHCVYRHARLGVETMQKTMLDAHRRFYRWGGWSLRRARAMTANRLPLADKLAFLWSNARTARATLRQWREEVGLFLEQVKARKQQCPASVDLQGR